MAGDPKLEASQVLPDFPYARYAELLGLRGIRVDAPSRWARPGTRRSRPTCRWCWRPSPTPRFRRCRPTSSASRPATSRRPWPAATPGARDIIRQSIKGKAQELFHR